jgi:hypothetical protein
MINRRANELARVTWELYRQHLVEAAMEIKRDNDFRPLRMEEIAGLVPDIRADLEPKA